MKKITAILLCLVMLLPMCACGETKDVRELFAMDTVITLTAYGKNADAGLDAAAGIINSMDTALDPESETGYLSILNNAEGEEVSVTPQIAMMLKTALEVNAASGGALDLSVYPLYLAWGEFKQDTGKVPSDEDIIALRKKLKFSQTAVNKLSADGEYTVKMPAGTQISFGAVAKGCAAQYAVDAMSKAGVTSAIVSLGGNVQTLGLKPDGSKWTVAVEDPNAPGSYLGTLSVGDAAIVTSGNYQRYFIGDDGVKYHHIIDPKTGRPVDNELLSVTIICDDGTLADCLSTAMYVLGEKAALKYWRNNGGFDMILVTNDGRVVCTKGLIEMFTLTNNDDYSSSYAE